MMRKITGAGLVLLVSLAVSSICRAVQLGDGYRYEAENYTCSISKTGWVSVRPWKGKDKNLNLFSPFLLSLQRKAGHQWQADKIEEIEGKEEDIEGGKLYTIKAKFLTGAKFTQKVTCTENRVKIEYKVRAIPGEHEFYILPMGSYKWGDKVWDSILSRTSLRYKLRGQEPGDLKDIMREGKARAIEIKRTKPAVEWLEIGDYYGRKIKVDILSNGTTLFYYDRGGPGSAFDIRLYGGTSEGSLSGASVSYAFQYTIEPLPDMDELEEETMLRVSEWQD